MPLQHLVDYFNHRFAKEHSSIFQPFIIKDEKVSGLYGPIRIGSLFSPIRKALDPTEIIGHNAQIEVSTYGSHAFYESEIEYLSANNGQQSTNLESIINFDRLSRTVHMLNYLTLAPVDGTLFLDVDPLHILGIKHDHGVYFGEVISQCGLKTSNVVIVLSLHSQYARYYQKLLAGLANYRHQGYQIALKFNDLSRDNIALDLIAKLSPNYVSVSAKYLDNSYTDSLFVEALSELTATVASVYGQSILHQVDQKKIDSLARSTHFDLTEGSYYQAIAFNYRGKSRIHERPFVNADRI